MSPETPKQPQEESSTIETQQQLLLEIQSEQAQKLVQAGLVDKFGQKIMTMHFRNISEGAHAFAEGQLPDDVSPSVIERSQKAIDGRLQSERYTVCPPHHQDDGMTYFEVNYDQGGGKQVPITVGKIGSDANRTVMPASGFSEADVQTVKSLTDEIEDLRKSGELSNLTRGWIFREPGVSKTEAAQDSGDNQPAEADPKEPQDTSESKIKPEKPVDKDKHPIKPEVIPKEKPEIVVDRHFYEEATSPRNILDLKTAYDRAKKAAEHTFDFDQRTAASKDQVDVQGIKKQLIDQYLQTGRVQRHSLVDKQADETYMQPQNKEPRDVPEWLEDEVAALIDKSYSDLKTMVNEEAEAKKVAEELSSEEAEAKKVAEELLYDEAVDPANILDLKVQIDRATSKHETEQYYDFDHRKETRQQVFLDKNTIRSRLIEAYIRTGMTPYGLSEVPEAVRESVDNLVNLSYQQVEAMLRPSETQPKEAEESHEDVKSHEDEAETKRQRLLKWGHFVTTLAGVRARFGQRTGSYADAVRKTTRKQVGRVATYKRKVSERVGPV